MNQDEIGNKIKQIRIDNNLTQADFASLFGVTYQAVSKWENGKNIPDISILRDICTKFNIDINDLLDNNIEKKKNNKTFIIIISILSVLLIGCLVFYIVDRNNHDFEFKTVKSTCDDYNINGSIAYNKDNTRIYISDINYCGESDEVYDSISCNLVKVDGNTEIILSKGVKKNNTNLENYLKDIEFNINEDTKTCKYLNDTSIELNIEIVKDGKTNYHKVPLKINDCDN